jgi:Reverse transcriptase (RNA-dependent DNA polymerase)
LLYSLCCFRKGSLTHSFRSACIRLIPKKGSPKKIGNWRPISLLSNLYKILSRALNNRLKIVLDRMTNGTLSNLRTPNLRTTYLRTTYLRTTNLRMSFSPNEIAPNTKNDRMILWFERFLSECPCSERKISPKVAK